MSDVFKIGSLVCFDTIDPHKGFKSCDCGYILDEDFEDDQWWFLVSFIDDGAEVWVKGAELKLLHFPYASGGF